MCTVSVNAWVQQEERERDLSRNMCFAPRKRSYLNEAADKSLMAAAKAERQQSSRNNRRARIIKLA